MTQKSFASVLCAALLVASFPAGRLEAQQFTSGARVSPLTTGPAVFNPASLAATDASLAPALDIPAPTPGLIPASQVSAIVAPSAAPALSPLSFAAPSAAVPAPLSAEHHPAPAPLTAADNPTPERRLEALQGNESIQALGEGAGVTVERGAAAQRTLYDAGLGAAPAVEGDFGPMTQPALQGASLAPAQELKANDSNPGPGDSSPAGREEGPKGNPPGGFLSRVPTWAKIAVPAVVVVAIVAAIIWGFYSHAQKRNEEWMKSKAAQEIVLVERARLKNDPSSLETIRERARARRERTINLIKEAEARGARTIENETHDPVDVAKRLAAADGLVAARADLNHNPISSDPKKRIGEELPSTWKKRIAEEEAWAKDTGFEGKLALVLQALAAELGRQDQTAGTLNGDIEEFGRNAPGLFSGKMSEETNRGRADLAEFRRDEIGVEQGLHDASYSALRGRIGERLYQGDREFKAARDRVRALEALQAADAGLPTALKAAAGVDKNLKEMIEHRRNEFRYLEEARDHENVRVKKSRDRLDPRTGRPIIDPRTGKPEQVEYWEMEDQSGSYKAKAAEEAAAAQANAAAAKTGLELLMPLIRGLYRDATIRAEGLDVALPPDSTIRLYEGNSVYLDLVLPARWSWYSNQYWLENAQAAQTSFAPVASSLKRVAEVVETRRGETSARLEAAVSAELDRQVEQARQGRR